ncbi:MAG: putative rane protein [Acidimicrobiales bacterium]|jgi:uncharacterized membrane protein SpoIIM required for sporulation|nr:putative rane protein [Acidimicrobiales bacterium]
MDLDRYLAVNGPTWARLGELTDRAGRGVGRLSAAELDELVRLYQRVSTHLSVARTSYRDPALVAQLSRLVARSGAVIYGTRARTVRALGRFFAFVFPAAVWHNRRFVAAAAALTFLPAIAFGTWIANSPKALDATGPKAVRDEYVHQRFEDYYRDRPAAAFALQVQTNNVQVGFMAFALGIAFCIPAALLLAFNGANLGFAAGLFAAAGEQGKFWSLIIPHGLLELSAVVLAGAAGLRLGWTIIEPGDRTRGAALTEEARRSFAISLGLILAFVVAGTIEGFVTGHVGQPAIRVAVGVVVEALFVIYLVGRGRAAAALGLTGAIGEADALLYKRPVAFTRR